MTRKCLKRSCRKELKKFGTGSKLPNIYISILSRLPNFFKELSPNNIEAIIASSGAASVGIFVPEEIRKGISKKMLQTLGELGSEIGIPVVTGATLEAFGISIASLPVGLTYSVLTIGLYILKKIKSTNEIEEKVIWEYYYCTKCKKVYQFRK